MKRKKVLIVAGVLTGCFGLAIYGLIGLILWISVAVYAPVDSYERIYTEPWASLNADMMLFQNEAHFNEAHSKLDKIPLHSKDRIVAEFLMGKSDLYLHNLDEAESHFQWIVSSAESGNFIESNNNLYFTDEANASLAKVYYLQQKPNKALEAAFKVDYAEDLEDPYFYTALLDVLENPKRGDLKYQLAQELKHSLYLSQARQEMLEALSLTKNPDLTLMISNELKTEMPLAEHDEMSPIGRYLNLAGNYYKNNLERPSTAIQFFEKALDETPDFEWTHQQLALSYYDVKKPDKGRHHSAQAISLNDQFYLPYLTMGDEALDQEDYQAAINHFNQAKKIVSAFTDSKHQKILNNIETQLGYTYESLDQPDKARSHYQYVVKHASRESGDYQFSLRAMQRL